MFGMDKGIPILQFGRIMILILAIKKMWVWLFSKVI